MKFSQVKRMKVPGGSPKRITHDDELLWTNAHEYVSLGDGIAGGHHIDDELQISFAQYGENGRTETEIIGGSYTTLLYDALTKKYKDRFVVSVKSFAQLGETVDSLREKLSHDSVKKALEKASVVTICVGATDLQTPDLPCLSAFTDSDDTTLQNITDQIRSNITLFANNLYILFNQLNEINPRAKYVFTTIYNPYKYLRLSQDVLTSFIWPLLNDIPSEVIEGSPANGSLYKIFITNAYVNFCTRINFLGTWCGMLLAPLNDALHNLVDTYREKHSNILLADISAAWNVVPNRAVNSERYYSDLVHVEYMDITDEDKIPWEALWRGSDKTTYWSNLISKYTISAEEFDFQGFTKELLIQVADKVLGPSISAYPLYYGHDVIHKVFADVLGVQKMPKYTITFKANGGSGLMDAQEVKGINTAPAYVNLNANAFIAETEYHFTGWNTAADGSGTVYKNEQLIGVASDITLYPVVGFVHFGEYGYDGNPELCREIIRSGHCRTRLSVILPHRSLGIDEDVFPS